MMNKNPDFDGELDELINRVKSFFAKKRINEFLQAHHQISVLFTKKLQFLIDEKAEDGKQVMEYNLNVDPEIIAKIDTFNQNLSKLSGELDEQIKIQRKTQ